VKQLLFFNENIWVFFAGIFIHARAPPENYYGRFIGTFTEFAHGIQVTMEIN
jgi:hypothetical protein